MKTFRYEDQDLPVSFVETIDVQEWVQCDVYDFVDDSSKDLWVVRLEKWVSSPYQLVVWWDKTLLGYISGNGKFIFETDEWVFEYKMRKGIKFEFLINKWEKMKWIADNDSELMYYEVYLPPYRDGRYLDL